MKRIIILIVLVLNSLYGYSFMNEGKSGNNCSIYVELQIGGDSVSDPTVANDLYFCGIVVGTADSSDINYSQSRLALIKGKYFALLNLQGFKNPIDGNTAQIKINVVQKSTGHSVSVLYAPEGGFTPSGVKYAPLANIVPPEPTFSVSNATLCVGATGTVKATLTNAPAGYTIKWGDDKITTAAGSTATAATGNIAVGLTAGPHNFTASLMNGTTEVKTAPYTVTVNALPTIGFGTSPTEACDGTNVTLTASGGGTYKWTAGITGNPTTPSINPKITADTKFTVEVTQNGCVATKDITVKKLENPTVTAALAAGSAADVCAGTKIGLTSTPTGGSGTGYTYLWKGVTATAVQNPTDVAISVGAKSITVEVTDSKKCKATSTPAVVVTGHELAVAAKATPNPITVSGGTTTLSATMTPNPAGTATPYEYTWTSPNNKLAGNTGASTEAGPATVGLSGAETFGVTVTDKWGCPGTSSVTVTVTGAALAGTATGGSECFGTAIDLKSNATGGSGNYAATTWTPSAGLLLSATTGANVTVLATTPAGNYTVDVVIGDGVTTLAAQTVNVTVKEQPVLSNILATPANLAIGGATTTLTVDVMPTTANVNWSGGAFTGATAGTSVTGGPYTTAGTVTYTATADLAGCTAVATVPVTVSGAVECTGKIVMAAAAPTCDGTTITLTASGGTKYSFKLRNARNETVLTVVKSTSPWSQVVTQGGKYSITDFLAYPDTISSAGCTGTVEGSPLEVKVFGIPYVSAGTDQISCGTDMVTLTATINTTGLQIAWNNGIFDGVAFTPPANQITEYIVTATTDKGCSSFDTVLVTTSPKPVVVATVTPEMICQGDAVTLSHVGSDLTAAFVWNAGQEGIPYKPAGTMNFILTGTLPTTCFARDTVLVTVNTKPEIAKGPKSRNIAIGKDVDFTVEALGNDLHYQWQRWDKANNGWINLVNSATSSPKISGADSARLVLREVPRSWDQSKFNCVVSNNCGSVSAEATLGVKECFDIAVSLEMTEGIMKDLTAGSRVDGWYCMGTKVAFQALVSQEEGYEIENPKYKWYIDGEPADKVIASDSSILSWIPTNLEDDFKIKVGVYSDGACDTVFSKVLQLKSKIIADSKVKIMTSIDPERSFCPGDEIKFWVSAKGQGSKPKYEWQNDVFNMGTGEMITMKMTEEDTWIKVMMTPSEEICTGGMVYADTIHLKVKEFAHPTLKIINNINDTIACPNDRLLFTAIYEGAGVNPTIYWRKDVWDLDTGKTAVVELAYKDVWVKCRLIPSAELCYTGGPWVDTMKITVAEEGQVFITSDMENCLPGDEITFTSELRNILGVTKYEWHVNDWTARDDEDVYVSDQLETGDIVQLAVSGDRVCQQKVYSNEIEVKYGIGSRDTLITIYKNETIKKLDLAKPGDEKSKFEIPKDGRPDYGKANITANGWFSYTPEWEYTGSDVVHYLVKDKSGKGKTEEGTIYITIKDNSKYFVPNIITPNNDGFNDTWKLDFLADYPDHRISVFNRNGQLVFSADNYQNDWDGTGQNKNGYVAHFNLPNGVYTYMIDLGNKVILKNWLEIRGDMNRSKSR